MTLPAINFLWIGPQLGYIEQLSIRSALAMGHPVSLFSYTPNEVGGVPDGAEVRNANEVMSQELLMSRAGSKWMALASDLWRYELLSQGRGYWCDLDVLLLKPLDFANPYVFGLQDETTINGAILHAPQNSAFVRGLREAPRPNQCPAWFGPKRSAAFYFQRIKGRVGLEDMPWGTYGPDLVTYMAKKHNVAAFAQAEPVFYPVPWQQAHLFYEPAEVTEHHLTEHTRAVHLWHGRLGDLAKAPPPRGSFIGQMLERFAYA